MPTSLEQLLGLLNAIGPAGTALAIAAVPVVTGAAVYITRMGSQSKIDHLEGELKALKSEKDSEHARSEQQYQELNEKYQTVLRRGALVQSQLDVIADEARQIAEDLDATDYAVLVPAPTMIPGDVPEELVFLCASGPQAAKLMWVRVPMSTSLSGQVFLSGQATIASPPPSGKVFASRTDKITDYRTVETLSVCLRYRSDRLGVAQFLNKRGARFDATDTVRAADLCSSISIRVKDFLADPRRLIDMGHAPRRNQLRVTAMFIDLSNSASLFGSLDSSVVADLLNQFFQELCGPVFEAGGTVDQFIGDGALFVFNLDQNKGTPESTAFAAARKMRSAFGNLRDRWTTLGYVGTEALFVRIGLSCGVVTRAELGHPQSRRITVIGPAVSAAAHACAAGPRDRDTICITQEFLDSFAGAARPETTPLHSDKRAVFEAL